MKIILAWIRKIQYALRECSESIRNAQSRKKELRLPPDKPIEVRAVVSFDEKTVADTKAENGRAYATQESIKHATWAAFVAVTIYALITIFMWCQMIKQSRIASESLQQSTEFFRIDERAWIEIDPIKPKFMGSDPTIGTMFTCEIYPRNVGKTVATDIVVKAATQMTGEGFGNDRAAMAKAQDQFLLDKFTEMGTGNPVRIPPNPIPKVLAPNTTSTAPFGLTCQPPQVFSGNQMIYYMLGRIDYCDQFHVKHWKKFCYFVVNARGEVWNCQEGNDEDRNTETQTPETTCGTPN